jgi:hexosaminidase
MAEAKLNVFHWHLSENQGYRVESKKFPKLQLRGSDGNYYTQKQVKEVVAYARERGIRVIPEFDMPGHTTAWLVGYPNLAAAPGPYKIERKFGVFDPAFDPTRENVYNFLDVFIGEMAGLFPDEYFHIGGDEVNGKQWDQNPDIQAFKKAHRLKTNADLQTYFNGRLSTIVTKHGKKMVGWDEVLSPGLPKDTVVQTWRGPQALAESASKGYDGILSDGYYLDHIRSAAFHYAVDPLPQNGSIGGAQRAHILGGEACMWGEYVSPETIDSRIWPRTLAVAERLWSPASVRDTADFYRRMGIESARLSQLGVKHESNYLPMLSRITGSAPVKSIKVLADVVEPVKFYERGRYGNYTMKTPLDHLVDAARPESEKARLFQLEVDKTISSAPDFGTMGGLKASLQEWAKNDKALKPLLRGSVNAREIAPLSRNLAISAQVGVEALRYLATGKSAPVTWGEMARKTLDKAQEPKAALTIAVIPGIRKLALAACQFEKIKGNQATAWNKALDKQVEATSTKVRE